MPTRQNDLLLNEIEIVEQPGLCRDNPLSWRGCGCHEIIRRQQHALIVRKPWQQPVRPRVRIDSMLAGQRHRVPLQLLDAEQLLAQQFRIPGIAQRIPCGW